MDDCLSAFHTNTPLPSWGFTVAFGAKLESCDQWSLLKPAGISLPALIR